MSADPGVLLNSGESLSLDSYVVEEHESLGKQDAGLSSNGFDIFPENLGEVFDPLDGTADAAEETGVTEDIQAGHSESDPAVSQAEETSVSPSANSNFSETEREPGELSRIDRILSLKSKTDELIETLHSANGPPEGNFAGFSVYSSHFQGLDIEAANELRSAFTSSSSGFYSLIDPDSRSLSPRQALRVSHGTRPSDSLLESIIDASGGENALEILGQPESRRIHLTPEAPLDANGNLDLSSNDVLSGNGEILGNVFLDGLLSPGNSPGIVSVDGDFTVDAAGTIQIEIGGNGGAGAPDGHDQVQASGNVALAGTLNIELLNGFLPAAGDSFEILTYGGLLAGAFTDASGMFGFGDGSLYFDIDDSIQGKLSLIVKEVPGASAMDIQIGTDEGLDAFGKLLSDYFPDLTAVISDVTLRVSDFLYLKGDFAFGIRPLETVTLGTGIPANLGNAAALVSPVRDAITANGLNAEISDNLSAITDWNVAMLTIGGAGLDGYIGLDIPDPLQSYQDQADLSGFVVDDLEFGLAIANSLVPVQGIRTFLGGYGQADRAVFKDGGSGLLKATARGVEFILNDNIENWPGDIGPAVIDWQSSYPDGPDGDSLADGLAIPTGAVDIDGNEVFVEVTADGNQRLGVEIEYGLARFSDFAFLEGSFGFEKGPQMLVDVSTGIPGNLVPLFETGVGTAFDQLPANVAGATLLSSDGSMITGLDVARMRIGGSNLSAFFGAGLSIEDSGILDTINAAGFDSSSRPLQAYLSGADSGNLYGFRVPRVDFAGALFDPTLNSAFKALGIPFQIPNFTAAKATAAGFDFIGLEEVLTVEGQNVTFKLNNGEEWDIQGAKFGPPVVDFSLTFDEDLNNNGVSDPEDQDLNGDGELNVGDGFYAVPTGGVDANGDPVFINLDYGGDQRIGVEIGFAEVTVAGLAAFTGGVEFEKGPRTQATLSTGQTTEVEVTTLAASNAYGFVGFSGPYWRDTNGDNQIITAQNDPDRDTPNAQAVGLSLEGVDFGFALMQPTLAIGPAGGAVSFGALKANVDQVQFVGANFLTANIQDLGIDLNFGRAGAAPFPAVNLKTTFPADPGNDKPQAGLVLTPGSESIVLDYSNSISSVHFNGTIGLKLPGTNISVVALDGAYLAETTTTQISILADANVQIGPSELNLFDLSGIGALAIKRTGFATDFEVGLSVGGGSVLSDVFGLDAKARIIANTTSQNQSVFVPDTFKSQLSSTAKSRLTPNPSGPGSVFVVPKGAPKPDGSNAVAAPYVVLSASGSLDFGDGFATMDTDFFFGMTPTSVDVSFEGNLSVSLLGSFHAEGGLGIDASGISGSITVSANSSNSGIPGIDFDTSYQLEVNTKSGSSTIDRPSVNPSTGEASGGTESVQIDGHSVRLFAYGDLAIEDVLEISGVFVLSGSTSGIELLATGTLNIDLLGGVAVNGAIELTHSGAAAYFDLGGSITPDFGADVGLGFSGDLRLELNTSGSTKTVGSVEIAPGIRISFKGDLEFLGFAEAAGTLVITIGGGEYGFKFELVFAIGPIEVETKGNGVIKDDGIVLDTSVDFEGSVLGILGIEASGDLEINTTTTDSKSPEISAHTFRLDLDGEIDIAGNFLIEADFVVEVRDGEWRADIKSSIEVFDFIGMDLEGTINSEGEFKFNLSAEVVIGVEGTGLFGGLEMEMSFTDKNGVDLFGNGSYKVDFDGEGFLEVQLFDVTLARASINIDFEEVDLASLPFPIPGLDGVALGRVTIEACVYVADEDAEQCQEFVIGTFGVVPPPPVELGSVSNGTLTLNVGDRADRRGVEEDNIDEIFKIRVIDEPVSSSGQTVQISAFGRRQVLENVTSIEGDFWAGTDAVEIDNDFTGPVEFSMGTGSDTVNHFGPGDAEIDMGSGSGQVRMPQADGTIITGEKNDTILLGSGTVTVIAGTVDSAKIGNDTISNATGDVQLDYGAFNGGFSGTVSSFAADLSANGGSLELENSVVNDWILGSGDDDITFEGLSNRTLNIENQGNGSDHLAFGLLSNTTLNLDDSGGGDDSLSIDVDSTGGNLIVDRTQSIVGSSTVNFELGHEGLTIKDAAAHTNLVTTQNGGKIDLEAVRFSLNASSITSPEIRAGGISLSATGAGGNIDLFGDLLISTSGPSEITLSAANGQIRLDDTDIRGAGAALNVNARGVSNLFDTTVAAATINLTGTGSTTNIVLRETDDLNSNGIVSNAGIIDLKLAARDSRLSLDSGQLGSNGAGKDILLLVGDLDFKGGNGTVFGTGQLTIQPTETAWNYRLGSAGETAGGTDHARDAYANTLEMSMRDMAALRDGFSKVTIGRSDPGNSMIIGDAFHSLQVKATTQPRDVNAALKDETVFLTDVLEISGDIQAPSDSVEFHARTAKISRVNLHTPEAGSDSGVSARNVLFDVQEQMLIGGWVIGSVGVAINVSNSTGVNNISTPGDGLNSLTTDVGSRIESLNAGSTITINTNASIRVAGLIEVHGTGSALDLNSPTLVKLLEGAVVAGRDAGALLDLEAGQSLSMESGSAVTAGAVFDNSSGSPVPVLVGLGADVILTSANEMKIGGSVTSADELTIRAGGSLLDHSVTFNQIKAVDPEAFLIGHRSYSLFLTGTITTLGPDRLLRLAAEDDVILRGNINVLGANSDLLIQSNVWVYVEGFIKVTDDVQILGGLGPDGTNLNGAEPRGTSIYVHATAQITTSAAGSSIDVRGAKDVDLFGALIAGGKPTATGVSFTGDDAVLSVTAGQQLYVATGLLASHTVNATGGTAGADDVNLAGDPLGFIVTTAGGMTAGGLSSSGTDGSVNLRGTGDLEMLGTIISGGKLVQTFDAGGNLLSQAVEWATEPSARPSAVLIQVPGRAFVGGLTKNAQGEVVETGGFIRAGKQIEVIGGTHSSGTGVLVHPASEITTNDPNGVIIFRSGADAEVNGLVVPGGRVDTINDPTGSFLGRVPVLFGGDSVLRIEAAKQIRIGLEMQAGKLIDLVGGSNSSGRGIVMLGSGRLVTARPDSRINLNAPGRVDILAPAHTNEIEPAGFIATADGKLAADVRIDFFVNKVDFEYAGSVTVPAAATADNDNVADLVEDIEAAIAAASYTVTRSDNASFSVGDPYLNVADDPSTPGVDPDLDMKLKNGKLLFTGPYQFKIRDTSVNAGLLGLSDLAGGTRSSGLLRAIEAPGAGSVVSIGAPAGPNGKLYIAGKVLGHDEIKLFSGVSPDGVDIDLDFTGVLETVKGSIGFNAGVVGEIKGDVLARGDGSDVNLGSKQSLIVRGLIEADDQITVSSGQNIVPGEVSVAIEATSKIRSLGGGGQIAITGLNDVNINGVVGPGSVNLDLLRIEATHGNLTVTSAAGRIESDAIIELAGAAITVAGSVKGTGATPATDDFEFQINGSASVLVTGEIDVAGSARITGPNAIDLYDATVTTGERMLLNSNGNVGLGRIDRSGPTPVQRGAVIQTGSLFELTTQGSVSIGAGAQILARADQSRIAITARDLSLTGALHAGGALNESAKVVWTGRNGAVDIDVTDWLTIGGDGVDAAGKTVVVGGSILATGRIDLGVSNGSLLMNAKSLLRTDATGAGTLVNPIGPSSISIQTSGDLQIHGLIEALDDGSDISLTAGGLVTLDGFVQADDDVTVTGGTSQSTVSIWVTEFVFTKDASGGEVRVSGGTLNTGNGGSITLTGTQTVLLNGTVGQPRSVEVGLVADVAAITVTTAGDIFVSGTVDASDHIALNGKNVTVLNNGTVHGRGAAAVVELFAPTGSVLVIGGNASVESAVLAHLFAGVIHIEGVITASGTLGRVLLNAVTQVTIVGTINSSGDIDLHAGVGVAWTPAKLLSNDKKSSDLAPASVTISGSGKLNATGNVRVIAGNDFNVLADAALADKKKWQQIPIISQEPAIISIVTGSRTVTNGFILVPRINWVETEVIEQVGTEEVKIGDVFHTMDITLTQDGYYNGTTKTKREWFIGGVDYFNNNQNLWGNAGTPASTATFNELNDAQRLKVLEHLGYKRLFNFSFANPQEYRVINGSPSVSNWTPPWKNNRLVYLNPTQLPDLSDKWIRLPEGALDDVLRLVSQGQTDPFQETVGTFRDQAVVRYTQDRSTLVSTSGPTFYTDDDSSPARWNVTDAREGKRTYTLTDGVTGSQPHAPDWSTAETPDLQRTNPVTISFSPNDVEGLGGIVSDAFEIPQISGLRVYPSTTSKFPFDDIYNLFDPADLKTVLLKDGFEQVNDLVITEEIESNQPFGDPVIKTTTYRHFARNSEHFLYPLAEPDVNGGLRPIHYSMDSRFDFADASQIVVQKSDLITTFGVVSDSTFGFNSGVEAIRPGASGNFTLLKLESVVDALQQSGYTLQNEQPVINGITYDEYYKSSARRILLVPVVGDDEYPAYGELLFQREVQFPDINGVNIISPSGYNSSTATINNGRQVFTYTRDVGKITYLPQYSFQATASWDVSGETILDFLGITIPKYFGEDVDVDLNFHNSDVKGTRGSETRSSLVVGQNSERVVEVHMFNLIDILGNKGSARVDVNVSITNVGVAPMFVNGFTIPASSTFSEQWSVTLSDGQRSSRSYNIFETSARVIEQQFDYEYNWTSIFQPIEDTRTTTRFQYVSTAEDVFGFRPRFETFNTQVKVVEEAVVTQWKTELITQDQVVFVTSRVFNKGLLRDFGTFGDDAVRAGGNVSIDAGRDVILSGVVNAYGSLSEIETKAGRDVTIVGSLPSVVNDPNTTLPALAEVKASSLVDIDAAGKVDVAVSGAVRVDNGGATALDRIELTAGTEMSVEGELFALEEIVLNANDDIQVKGTISAGHLVDINAGLDGTGSVIGSIFTDLSTFSGSQIDIDAGATQGTIDLTNGTLSTSGSINLTAPAGAVIHSGGLMRGDTLNANLKGGFSANASVKTANLVLTGKGDVTLTNQGNLVLNNAILPDGALKISAIGAFDGVSVQLSGGGDEDDFDLTTFPASNGLSSVTLRDVNIAGEGDLLVFAQNGSFATLGALVAHQVDLKIQGGITLNTNINDLAIRSTGLGDVNITHPGADPLTLRELEVLSGAIRITTGGTLILQSTILRTNAEANDITINAGGDIQFGALNAGVYAGTAADAAAMRLEFLNAALRSAGILGAGASDLNLAGAQALDATAVVPQLAAYYQSIGFNSSDANSEAQSLVTLTKTFTSLGDIELSASGSIIPTANTNGIPDLVAREIRLTAASIGRIEVAANALPGVHAANGDIEIIDLESVTENSQGLNRVDVTAANGSVSILALESIEILNIQAPAPGSSITVESRNGSVQVVEPSGGGVTINSGGRVTILAARTISVEGGVRAPDGPAFRAASLLIGENAELEGNTLALEADSSFVINGSMRITETIELVTNAGNISVEGGLEGTAGVLDEIVLIARGNRVTEGFAEGLWEYRDLNTSELYYKNDPEDGSGTVFEVIGGGLNPVTDASSLVLVPVRQLVQKVAKERATGYEMYTDPTGLVYTKDLVSGTIYQWQDSASQRYRFQAYDVNTGLFKTYFSTEQDPAAGTIYAANNTTVVTNTGELIFSPKFIVASNPGALDLTPVIESVLAGDIIFDGTDLAIAGDRIKLVAYGEIRAENLSLKATGAEGVLEVAAGSDIELNGAALEANKRFSLKSSVSSDPDGNFRVGSVIVNALIKGSDQTLDELGIEAGGDITLKADAQTSDSVTLTAGGKVQTSEAARITTNNLAISAGAGINVKSNVVNLTAQVTGAGDLTVSDSTAINLNNASAIQGSVNVSAAGNIVVAQDVTASSEVALSSSGGAVRGGSIIASRATLNAATGIGDLNVVSTAVAELAASTAGGNIHLQNNRAGAVTVSSLSALNGDVRMRQLSADSLSVGSVAVNGGDVLIDLASGNGSALTVANVATGKLVTLISSGSAALTGAISLTGPNADGNAGLSIVAGSTITMAQGASVNTQGSHVRMSAGSNVTIAGINAGAGVVSVLSQTGSLLDGGDASVDIQAGALRVNAGAGVGMLGAGADNALEVSTPVLSLVSGLGGANLVNAGALQIGSVGVSVRAVDFNGGSQVLTDSVQAGLVSGGTVVVRTASGDLAVSRAVDVKGDLNLSSAGQLVLGDGLKAANTFLSAVNDATIGAGVTLATTGTFMIRSASGAVTMDGSSAATVANKNARIEARENIVISRLDAGAGSVSLVSANGSIIDAGTPTANVKAAKLRVDAGVSAGSGAAPIKSEVGTIAGLAGGNSVYLENHGSIVIGAISPIDVGEIESDGTLIVVRDPATMTGLTTRPDSNGSIVVRALGGSITVNDAVATDRSGNVLLESDNAGITLNTNVTSGSGHVSVLAGAGVIQSADIRTGGGTIDVQGSGGSIAMSGGAAAMSGGGNIRYRASQNITLSSLNAGGGSISLRADTGWIRDANEQAANLIASAARIETAGDVGAEANAIETTLATIAIAAGGNVFLAESDGIAIGTVGPVAANRVQSNASTIILTDTGNLVGASAAASAVTLSAGGAINVAVPVAVTDLSLQTTSGDVTLQGLVTASGSVAINAAGAVLDGNGDAVNVIADGLTVTSVSGMGSGNALETKIKNFHAANSTSGNIELINESGLAVSGITSGGAGNVILTNMGAATISGNVVGGGEIEFGINGGLTINADVTAEHDVTLTANETDPAAADDDITLTANGSILSRNGNILLQAGDDISTAVGSSLSAPNGSLTITMDFGDNDPFGASSNLQGTVASNLNLILGGPADDVIDASNLTQPLVIIGGQGNDNITAGQGPDVIYGGPGNDTINGNAGADIVIGGAGTDTLRGGTGNDIIIGDQAELTIGGTVFDLQSQFVSDIGGADDNIDGEAGDDILVGDSGRVEMDADKHVTLVRTIDPGTGANDVIAGGDGDDTAFGGAGVDQLNGGLGKNVLLGDMGVIRLTPAGLRIEITSTDVSVGANDVINSGAGDDVIIGGFGADTIHGGAGNDDILGDNGRLTYTNGALTEIATTDPAEGAADDLNGGEGDDTIFGGSGVDQISGGSGRNILIGDQGKIVLTESGERIQVTTTFNNIGAEDVITSGEGDDVIIGGFGADTINGGAGNDTILGDNGVLDYTNGNLTSIATADPATGAGDVLDGGAGNDTIFGGSGVDQISGGSGRNILIGDQGTIVLAESGERIQVTTTFNDTGANDTINSGDGDDTIIGGFGSDIINGGAGNDDILGDNGVLDYTGGVLTLITTADPSNGSGDIIDGADGNDTIIGGTGADQITGGADTNIILGDQGVILFAATGERVEVRTTDHAFGADDLINSGTGDDVILGGSGSDPIQAGGGDDIVLGDNGRLVYTGGQVTLITTDDPASGAAETINGGEGSDTIFGGTGADTLTGDVGNDILVGDHGSITFAANGDRIEIKTIDTGLGANDGITGAEGDDIILGGFGADTLAGNIGNDVVLGDNGRLGYTGGQLTLIATIDPAFGDTDLINGNEGDDILLGGAGAETIDAAEGHNIVMGDNGELTFDGASGQLISATSIATAIGGNDTITAGAG
ncbi:MAG: hypothetical protein O2960_01835, partial [Verrucomicrobia bacterium]|nr:hypothetical protein [Verrucomicrobiota bacterium]